MNRAWERAVTHGDVEGVREMLRDGFDADSRDRHGRTALMIAARAGHTGVVRALIDAGADLDVTAKFGLSAVMLAIVAGHESIAEQLAQAGADLSLRGSGAPGFAGKSAVDLAHERGMHDLQAFLARKPSTSSDA